MQCFWTTNHILGNGLSLVTMGRRVTFAGATENSLAEMEAPSAEVAQLKLGRGVPRTTAPKKASSA